MADKTRRLNFTIALTFTSYVYSNIFNCARDVVDIDIDG